MSKSDPISNMNCSICDKTSETVLAVCCNRQVCSDCVSYCNQQWRKQYCNKTICNECILRCEFKDCNDVSCVYCRDMMGCDTSQCHICKLYCCLNHIKECGTECGKMVCKKCIDNHANDGYFHIFPNNRYNDFFCDKCFNKIDWCFKCRGNFDYCKKCNKQYCGSCDYSKYVLADNQEDIYCYECAPIENDKDTERK
jgi:hypothetical protein